MPKPIVSNRALRLLRRIAERAMQNQCTILDPAVPTSDSGGDAIPGTPTERVSACLFFEPSGDEASEDVVQVRGRYRVSLPYGTAISEQHQIRYAGRVYEVAWVPVVTALDVDRTVGVKDVR